ncbi:MAG TPA: hypothetical protein VGQ86_08850 [Candidatus Limnocylindria bacterium]|jgi:hypothetical protein|nr:hypothetical protein [Candidatus Limnocylindria bacterium]
MFVVPLWFLAGLALGLIMAGFLAIGSYQRGYQSARRRSFGAELRSRHSTHVTPGQRAAGELDRQTA